ncbi:MAG: hypothetical protein GC181_05380 [Bacteroidetes bacterium]|nr:hypothetical protein [Bacteroidota bacterium]
MLKSKVSFALILNLLVIMSVFSGCKKPGRREAEAETETVTETVTEDKDKTDKKGEMETLCFLSVFRGEPIREKGKIVQEMIDSTKLTIRITDNNVRGTFEILPAEKDAAIGTFIGDFSDDKMMINADYHYVQEGDSYNEPIQIELSENHKTIRVRFDSHDTVWIELQRVDCR